MPYVIGAPCMDIKDNSCVAVCPVDCIYELGRMRVINPNECIDCGACVPECPVDAIYPDDELPEAWEEFVAINAAVADDAGSVDALVDEYARTHNVRNVRPTAG
ncbi:ferredoxin family protein [Streptomyces plumbiresistens]|uniref:Ferredoxin n=1 Tax=Streptomyces plumbiresistens TaxID=511811 RepID=A0ABP7SK46_9ACTN